MRSICMTIFFLCTLFFMIPVEAQTQDTRLMDAETAFDAGDYQKAEAVLRKMIQEDPHCVRALDLLARLYATAADPDFFDGKTAVELALMALDDDPDNPEIIATLAQGYFAQNKFAQAAHEFNRAFELNPLELNYARQVKKVATTWLARLSMNAPNRDTIEKAQAAFTLGQADLHLGEIDDAVEVLDKAYKMGSPTKDVCIWLARAMRLAGNPEPAVEILQGLGERAAQDAEVLFELGQVLAAAADFDGARSCMEEAYGLNPELPGLCKALGALDLDTNKPIQAVILLKEAMDHLDRDDLFVQDKEAEILYLTARALAGGDELDEAVTYLLDALSLKADLSGASEFLEALYTRRAGSMKGFEAYITSLAGDGVVRFSETSREAGVDATGSPTFGDYDGDGDPDLLLNGSRLFENDGRGRFKEVTAEQGLTEAGGDAGIFGDYDNDGDLDCFVLVRKQGFREKLYRNDQRHGFKDVSEEAGYPSDVAPTQGAAFGDLNRDGWLDLYLANGGVWDGPGEGEFSDTLLLGNGKGGFENATSAAGLDKVTRKCSQGVCLWDYDNDGDLDGYVTNARMGQNLLLRNRGDGTFEVPGDSLGLAGCEEMGRFGDSAGTACGDVDNDGDLDLIVANRVEPRKALY
ncbi:MAG: VCBS repeat-containing protein, partial [Planctomycetes bacterium]|nr:VCBS repeat-containing protein [Planctomycetota bacterium]